MQVDFSSKFLQQLDKWDSQYQDIIADFVDYVEQHGLKGLTGRNKPSAPINPRTKKEQANFEYAQKTLSLALSYRHTALCG